MPDPKTREQSGLPRIIVQCIQRLYQHARPYLPESALTLGGGTVLAARWSHRISTDADLFCPPETFDAVGRADASDKPLLGIPEEPYDFHPKAIIRMLAEAALPGPDTVPGGALVPGC